MGSSNIPCVEIVHIIFLWYKDLHVCFQNHQHFCEVSLNGFRFCGSQCHSKEEAAESAAGVALLQLVSDLPLS